MVDQVRVGSPYLPRHLLIVVRRVMPPEVGEGSVTRGWGRMGAGLVDDVWAGAPRVVDVGGGEATGLLSIPQARRERGRRISVYILWICYEEVLNLGLWSGELRMGTEQ